MQRTKKPLVIAGTYAEFRAWCHENNLRPSDAIYANSLSRVLGLHGNPIVRVGTWATNDVAYHPYVVGREKVSRDLAG